MDSIVASEWLRVRAGVRREGEIGDRGQTAPEFVASGCEEARGAARDTCEAARAAGERARQTCALSRDAQFRAAGVQGRARALRADYRGAFEGRMLRGAELAESGSWLWPVGRAFLVRESAWSGGDPAIEAANTLLIERYGVSRGEAFSLLKRASSRRHEKLASVARRLLDDDETSGRPRLGREGGRSGIADAAVAGGGGR